MIDLRRIVSRVTAWWVSRPTQRRIARVRARHIELKALLKAACDARDTRLQHRRQHQLQKTTTELLRLEQRRVA